VRAFFVSAMKRLFLILLFLPMLAQAEIKTISWTTATLNEDSTPFNAVTDQKEIRLTCFRGLETTPSVFVSPGIATSINIDFLVGTHRCTAQTIANNGEESQDSGELTFTIFQSLDPIPLPPSNLGQN